VAARKKTMNPDREAVDEYIAGFPPETRKALEEVRDLVRASAPEATETISYGVPTFVLNGYLVHFGGYRRHIGFYPTSSGIEAFKAELEPYKSSRGAVQFPLDRPMPADLIRRMVEFRVRENAERASK
jgi:uncharacterized protein YdhG (YjbR/CyaY superfamily)